MHAWIDGRFDVLISLPLLRELAEVLARARIRRKYNLSDEKVQHLLDLLRTHAIQVQPIG